MPAASFSAAAADDPSLPAVRQWAIEPRQCRWIVADEAAGADALMCGAPVTPRRSFCAVHCERAYLKPPDEAAEAPAREASEDEDPQEQEAEA